MCERPHGGIDGELVGGRGLVVERALDGDRPERLIDGEEGRGGLEGEEHAAPCALVGIGRVHHEDRGPFRRVLRETGRHGRDQQHTERRTDLRTRNSNTQRQTQREPQTTFEKLADSG